MERTNREKLPLRGDSPSHGCPEPLCPLHLRPRDQGPSCCASDPRSRAHLPAPPLTDFGAVRAAIIPTLAVGPRGTLEVPAADGPGGAGAGLGAASGEPRLVCLQTPWEEKTPMTTVRF